MRLLLSKNAERLIGLLFIIGMGAVLYESISAGESPNVVTLFLIAALALLIGLYILAGARAREAAAEAHFQERLSTEPSPNLKLRTCGNCHGIVPDASKFCLHCGTKL